MGLIDWILKRRAKKILQKMPEDELGLMVSEYLKRTQKEHAAALRTSQNLNKAALMDMQTKQLKSSMKELLSDDEGEDEDDDEGEDEGDFGDKLLKDVVSKFLQSKVQQNQSTGLLNAPPEPSKMSLGEIAASLTPEQKKEIGKKFGINF